MRIRNIKNADDIITNSKYVIKDYKEYKKKFNELFKNNNPICLEIGMGKGDFIIKRALNNPNVNYIGLEKYTSIIAKACKKLENLDIPNLRIINADAKELNLIFDHEIDTIFLNFSDPWPKARHAKRRLTSPVFLKIYDDIFAGDAKIMQKTDNTLLFESSIIDLTTYGYQVKDISLDLWNTDKVYEETEYEHKFRTAGIKINYLQAFKPIKK